ncbi:hypothetical protein [Kitasatospora sp. KL5]|uniref:hypothetical protein n=1 Tax=Kitasatospora sp. KL5 TaxID=3425125 RepID=UPI003D6E98B1
MNNRRREQLLKAAAPLLIADEHVEFATLTKVGSVSAARRLATTAVVGVLTAGTVTAIASPRPAYLALTDRRLLFFDVDQLSGRPAKLLMAIDRGAVTASPAAKAAFGLLLTSQLSIAGEERGLKLTFATAFRADGRELLGRLPVTA